MFILLIHPAAIKKMSEKNRLISLSLALLVLYACRPSSSAESDQTSTLNREMVQSFTDRLVSTLNRPSEKLLHAYFQEMPLPSFLWSDTTLKQEVDFTFDREQTKLTLRDTTCLIDIPFTIQSRNHPEIKQAGIWQLEALAITPEQLMVTKMLNRELGQATTQMKRELRQLKEKQQLELDAESGLIDSARYYAQFWQEYFDGIQYFVKVNDQFFYYVVKGSLEEANKEKDRNYALFDLGVVDQNGQEIIPIGMDEIYNPDPGLGLAILVEKDQKLGYYNLEGKQLLEVIYDGIYPYPQRAKTLVQVRIDQKYGWINSRWQANFKSNSHRDKRLFRNPLETDLFENLSFAVETASGNTIFLRSMSRDWTGGFGTYIYPPHFRQLGIWRHADHDFYQGIMEKDHGILSVGWAIGPASSIDDQTKVLFSQFVVEGIDGQSDSYYDKKVISVNEKLQPIRGLDVLDLTASDFQLCANGGERFVEPNLIELWGDGDLKDHPTYSAMTAYKYYEVSESGRFKALSNNRQFTFTKYAKLEERYFKNCYSLKEAAGSATVLSRHLSLEDLDLMYHEILADYGYRFTDELWKQYFRAKSWYKPKYNNVDKRLSEVDQYNLKFIRNYQKRIQAKPEEYTLRDTVLSF